MSRVIATLKGGLEARRTRSLAELDVIYVYLDGFGEGGDELLTSFGFPGFNGGRCARRTRLRGSTKNFAGASRRKGRCRAVILLFSLVASGQMKLRRIDGWRKIAAVLSQHTAVAA